LALTAAAAAAAAAAIVHFLRPLHLLTKFAGFSLSLFSRLAAFLPWEAGLPDIIFENVNNM
jgi:hypothetical protein